MRKIITFCLLYTSTILVHAESGTVSGSVTLIRSQETVGQTFFQLDVAQAGTCGTYGNKVIFLIEDTNRGNEQFSIVLAARMSGTQVTVSFDDETHKVGNWCQVRYLDI